MHIELTRKSGMGLTGQIVQSFRDRIESGLMRPGEKLPSVRHLSAFLKISQVTVSKAYGELESGGFITCTQGRGCFVAAAAEQAPARPDSSEVWQLAVPDYLPRAQVWKHYNEGEEGMYRFNTAAIQPKLLPSAEIGRNIQRLIAEDPSLIGTYGPFQGDAGLLRTLSGYLADRGIDAGPEHVLVTSGSQQGIDLTARTFVGPGDTVYMEGPSYTGAIDVFASRGAKIITVPVDGEGMRTDLLTRLCDSHPPKVIYTIPAFHNPTGVTMSMRRRRELLQIAESYRCLIVEDDPFGDLHFGEAPPRTLKSMDREGHVIYLKSFSKVLSPGCRVACAVASGSLISRLIAAKATADLGSPLLPQKAIEPLLARKRYDAYLGGLRETLAARCRLVTGLLKQHAPAAVSWSEPAGGLNLWLTLPAWADSGDLYREALKENVVFLPGAACYAAEPQRNHLRLSFTQMEEEELREGTLRLCGLLHRCLAEQRESRGMVPTL
ncbi:MULTISPECIES: MocR-like pyridoxine biosynthesis transcription factor PdxR [Paenibacillus]|uniref:MocR-like pyridoxine biosynthesis transcription factor PdxR n=1 Tax=Paenibacillus TaxID=44249 RepID=UPI0022B8C842|nr:PLP-dependent aminotransferase family protein [Paenibacillus caseinilyticus]MCZ8519400.1 PLP-dependent aminotransferase family protein [Paenibacillus caseinilyticus]